MIFIGQEEKQLTKAFGEEYEDYRVRVIDRLAAAFKRPEAEEARGQTPLPEPLTEREIELLPLLAAGLTNEEISRRLFISLNTTKWHLKSIFGKLTAGNRTRAVARARELGLI